MRKTVNYLLPGRWNRKLINISKVLCKTNNFGDATGQVSIIKDMEGLSCNAKRLKILWVVCRNRMFIWIRQYGQICILNLY